METEHLKSITETSAMLNVTPRTIRYYLGLGLVPQVRINKKGYRILTPWQVDLLAILLGMKQAGFKTKDLRRYSRLFREGRRTEKERLAMLTTKKHQLRETIETCEKAIDFIERQEELYHQKHDRR